MITSELEARRTAGRPRRARATARCRARVPATTRMPTDDRHEHDRRPDVGLDEHQAHRHQADQRHAQHVGQRGLGGPHLATTRAASMRLSAIFANSDGVSWKPAELEPALRARRARAERRAHQHECDDRGRVDEPGVHLVEAVVERRDERSASRRPAPSAVNCFFTNSARVQAQRPQRLVAWPSTRRNRPATASSIVVTSSTGSRCRIGRRSSRPRAPRDEVHQSVATVAAAPACPACTCPR